MRSSHLGGRQHVATSDRQAAELGRSSLGESIDLAPNSTSCAARTGQGSHQTITFVGAKRAP